MRFLGLGFRVRAAVAKMSPRFCPAGQAAMDHYVSQIVAALRDFPFLQLDGGRQQGHWVRDVLVAPLFDGYWDFYSNRKVSGFNLQEFYLLLAGPGMLLERLKHARKMLQA